MPTATTDAHLFDAPWLQTQWQATHALMQRVLESGASASPCSSPADPVTAMVSEHLATGGKHLRALLALLAGRALNVEPQIGIAWAAAVELAHNATLVHDDFQDGDQTRRGKPTLWVTHGAAQAINAGDLLFQLPYMALAHGGASAAVQAAWIRAMAGQMSAVIRGQGLEWQFTQAQSCSPQDYRAAIQGKTSALFWLPVLGMLLAAPREGGSNGYAVAEAMTAADVDAVATGSASLPWRVLGTAFQIQDDVLDLFGEKGRGQVGNDIREGKISALTVAHQQLHPQDRLWLQRILAKPREQTSDSDVQAVLARFQEGGALAAVLQQLQTMLDDGRPSSTECSQTLVTVWQALVQRMLEPIAHLF